MSELVIPAPNSGQNNLHPAKWGCHHQLDDHHRNPNVNNRNHQVGHGQLTNVLGAQYWIQILDDPFLAHMWIMWMRFSDYLPTMHCIAMTNAYFSCFISKQNGGVFKEWPTVHWRTGPITHRLNQETFFPQWVSRWRKSLVSVPNFIGHWGQSNSIPCLVDILRLRGVEAPTNGSSLTGVSKATKKIRFLATLAALHFTLVSKSVSWLVGRS